ncbi:hypothetical protein GGX14DRAFT_398879 [Mycena pura]|uniref:Uncharacterized protein n=1 Tax=Mycena pura TaxID=153505 RepID=A0AAD6YD33_9AGAR|nr:hypothetical protein GGX14DRAFT_398879 [Mycena pura]
MPPDAPTFLPVPPYASQYLRVATNLRSPFSEPVNLRMSLTNIHDRPHNLWSSPHHLRSFIGSATQMSGDSEIQCLGNSAIRCLGDSAIRRFGDSAIRRFGGSAVRSHHRTIFEGTMEASTSARSLSSPPPPPPRHGLNGSNPLQRVYHSLSLSDDTCGHTGQSAGRLSSPPPLAAGPAPASCWPGLRTLGHAPNAPRRFGDSEGLLPPTLGASSWSPGPSTSTPKPGHTTPKAPRGFSVFLASFGVSRPLRSELRRSRRSAIPLGDFGDSEVHSHSRTTSEALSASAFRGFLAFSCFDAAALRSLGNFGGSQPLMNLRGPWCLGVTMPRRFGASAFRRFGVSLFRSFSPSQNLRRLNVSTFRSFSTSELRRFGVSAFRCFGASALRSFIASQLRTLRTLTQTPEVAPTQCFQSRWPSP